MARPVPADLEDALAASPAARERFGTLPPEQLDEWIGWVERARLPGGRRRRIAELVRRLAGRRPVAATIVDTNGGTAPSPPRDAWLAWVVALVLLGGIAALVVWFAVVRNDSGSKPGAVVVSAKATVPKVVGIRQQAATFQLEQAKLAATVVKRASAKPRDIVIGQKPAAGAALPQGSPVTIVVSKGPPGVKVPSVVGLAAADAAQRLGALKLATTLKQTPSKQPPGTVLGQKPPAGGLAKPGSAVVLEVAGSKASVGVPDVKGQTQQAAVASLQKAGLRATVAQVPSSQPPGTVVAQSPAAGQKAAQGSAVRLNVAKGGQAQTQSTQQQQTTTRSSSPPPPPPQQGSGNDYRGMVLSRAVEKILQGRQQVIVVWIPSSRPKGVVVANSTVGARERLQVSAGTQPAPATAVPDVSGESQSQATNDLQAAGFAVLTASWPVSDQSRNGVVVYETPSGGGTAPRGATIVIYIGSTPGG